MIVVNLDCCSADTCLGIEGCQVLSEKINGARFHRNNRDKVAIYGDVVAQSYRFQSAACGNFCLKKKIEKITARREENDRCPCKCPTMHTKTFSISLLSLLRFVFELRLRSETFWDKREKDYVSTNLLKYLVAFGALFVSSLVETTRKEKFSRYRYRHEELLHS